MFFENTIIKGVKTILGKISWRKVLTFFFFVLMAAALWFLQIFKQPFNSTLKIPIKYTHLPDSIFIENELPQEITVNITCSGALLFRYYLDNKNDSLEIDVEKSLAIIKNGVLPNSVIEELITSKLFNRTEIKSFSPARIPFEYSTLVSKNVPVIFDGLILINPGYHLNGDIKIYPDTVQVYGSERALKNVEFAYTSNDTIRNLTQPECVFIQLNKTKNIRYAPSRVELEIPIEQSNKKEVVVPITYLNIPSNMDFKTFPSTIKISFSVAMSDYSKVEAKDFALEIDCNDLKNETSMTAPVRLTKSPLYIHNLTLNPSEVEFVFEKKR